MPYAWASAEFRRAETRAHVCSVCQRLRGRRSARFVEIGATSPDQRSATPHWLAIARCAPRHCVQKVIRNAFTYGNASGRLRAQARRPARHFRLGHRVIQGSASRRYPTPHASSTYLHCGGCEQPRMRHDTRGKTSRSHTGEAASCAAPTEQPLQLTPAAQAHRKRPTSAKQAVAVAGRGRRLGFSAGCKPLTRAHLCAQLATDGTRHTKRLRDEHAALRRGAATRGRSRAHRW